MTKNFLNRKSFGFLLFLAAASVFWAMPAEASVVIADFNSPGYSTGNLDTQNPAGDGLGAWSVNAQGQNVGTGDIVPSSLPANYKGQTGVGQRLTVNDSSESNLSLATLDTAMISSEFWFSFVFDTGSSGNARRGLRLRGTGASELRVIEVGADLRIMTGNTTLATQSSVVAANTSYLLVGQLIADTSGTDDTVNLWLAPGDLRNLGGATLTWASDNFVQAANGINTLGAESYTQNNTSGGVDYLVLSDSMDGLLNELAPVPEPSTLVLITAGAAMLIGMRRKCRSGFSV